MKRIMLLVVLILSLLAFSAQGANITYGGLANPPGTYYGSGNPNTAWTVSTEGDLELGFRVFERFGPDAYQIGSEYFVDPGPTTVPGKTGSLWGFAFSVNTNVSGSGTKLVSDYNYMMSITDLNTSAALLFDPSLIPDNYLNGSTGFQNAESLHFAFLAIPLGYDMNAEHTYRFTLSATEKSIQTYSALPVANSVSVDVNVGDAGQVPEPGTYALMGIGLTGLALIRRRKA